MTATVAGLAVVSLGKVHAILQSRTVTLYRNFCWLFFLLLAATGALAHSATVGDAYSRTHARLLAPPTLLRLERAIGRDRTDLLAEGLKNQPLAFKMLVPMDSPAAAKVIAALAIGVGLPLVQHTLRLD